MDDFCDFLKGFDSSEAFMGKLVEAARGGLPDEAHVFKTFLCCSDPADGNLDEHERKSAVVTYKLKEVSGSIDPREKYSYVCEGEDAVEWVASKKAAILKSEILGVELLSLDSEEELDDD